MLATKQAHTFCFSVFAEIWHCRLKSAKNASSRNLVKAFTTLNKFLKHILDPKALLFKNCIYCATAGKYGPEKTPYLDTFHAVYAHET